MEAIKIMKNIKFCQVSGVDFKRVMSVILLMSLRNVPRLLNSNICFHGLCRMYGSSLVMFHSLVVVENFNFNIGLRYMTYICIVYFGYSTSSTGLKLQVINCPSNFVTIYAKRS